MRESSPSVLLLRGTVRAEPNSDSAGLFVRVSDRPCIPHRPYKHTAGSAASQVCHSVDDGLCVLCVRRALFLIIVLFDGVAAVGGGNHAKRPKAQTRA